MGFWYVIDEPRDRPAWEINPELWRQFCDVFNRKHGHPPERNHIYTEAYIVQTLDDGSFGLVGTEIDA